MKAKVLCILKKFVAELKNKEGVRPLRNGGMEVECDLKEVTKEGTRAVYALTPKVAVPPVKNYFELQLVERGERNIGEIVTNFSGQKLIPRWRAAHTVGFRTSRGQLISVTGYGIRGMVELVICTLQVEGRDVFLVEEAFGPFKARYDDSDDSWIVGLPKSMEQLGNAVVAAMEKADCNCFKKGCQSHYALTEEEARAVLAERKARQKAAAEALRQKPPEKIEEAPPEELNEETDEVPEEIPEMPAVTPVIEPVEVAPAVEASVEPVVETPVIEPPNGKKTRKAIKKAKKAE